MRSPAFQLLLARGLMGLGGLLLVATVLALLLSHPRLAVHRVEVRLLGDPLPVHSALVKAQEKSLERLLSQHLEHAVTFQPLQTLQQELAALPWVRSVALARAWPDRLVVGLELHRPAVVMEGRTVSRLLNDQGEMLELSPRRLAALESALGCGLVRVEGPAGTEAQLLRQARDLQPKLATHGLALSSLSLTGPGGWQFTTSRGDLIILGREQAQPDLQTRLRRGLSLLSDRQAVGGPTAWRVDLRYPSGAALMALPVEAPASLTSPTPCPVLPRSPHVA